MTAQPEEKIPDQAEKPPKVTFRITTKRKLPRGRAGITHLDSQPLSLGAALDWILNEVPDEAITITPDHADGNDAVTIRIDWKKVPMEIRDGRS